MSDSSGPDCPVCKEHTVADAAASQGILLAGMQAVLDRDHETIKDVYSTLTQWDAHVAITMLLMFVSDMCGLLGQDVRESLADMRRQVLSVQADQS